MSHYNISEQFEIRNKEGIDKLLDTLGVEIDRSGLKRLGIVVDADTDLAARWQSFRNILLDIGYKAIPSHPAANGTIVAQDGRPTVGIWLMPNNVVSGMLENFVGFLVPDPNAWLWTFAEQVLQQFPESERRFSIAHTSKAHLHTWLAWQEEPGTPMGLAITKRYFDANAPHAQQFINWIRKLYQIRMNTVHLTSMTALRSQFEYTVINWI